MSLCLVVCHAVMQLGRAHQPRIMCVGERVLFNKSLLLTTYALTPTDLFHYIVL